MKVTNIFFFMNMFSGIGFSIFPPLFPSMATKKGLTENLVGWIIGIFAFSSTCISPFTPIIIKNYSRVKLLYYSTFFEATCTLLYSFVNFIDSFYLLLIYTFIIRLIHGCSSGINGTLLYSLTITLSKKSEVKKSLGYLEIGWCLGIIIGPLLASIFYKFGGYFLPFLIIGIFLYTSVFLSNEVSKEKTESKGKNVEDPPFLKYLTHWEIIFILGIFFFGYISESFYYPCLTNHLGKYFGLSISVSSLFFIIISISNIIILQFLDSTTKMFGLYGTSCIGLLIVSLGVLMVYPYPPIPKKLFFVVLGFVLIGIGDVPIFIPGLIALNKNIKRIDPNIDDLSANDITSAINFLILNIADFCGPIIGGFFSTRFGFKHCCLIVSCIIIIYCIVYFIYFHKIIYNDFLKRRRESSIDTESNSNENVLISHSWNYKKSQDSENILRRRRFNSGTIEKKENIDFDYMELDYENL